MTSLLLSRRTKTALHQLRSYARPAGLVFKQADLGGDQETGFEQAFAQLAYTYIQDKAPKLLDYLVGFQLVERNDDDTKAAGIFGFKAGNQWLYAPVFFISGDLKGHELLYLKNKNIFVPLKENWINYLLAQKPQILGKPEYRSLSQLGVRGPDLRRLSVPSGSAKYGSAGAVSVDLPHSWPEWMVEFAPQLGRLISNDKSAAGLLKAAEALSLEKMCSESLTLCKMAYETGRHYPAIGAAVERFHGPDFFTRCLTALRKQAELQSPTAPRSPALIAAGPTAPGKPTSDAPIDPLSTPVEQTSPALGGTPKMAAADKPVKIIVRDEAGSLQDRPDVLLESKDKEKLLRNGYLVRDYRKGDEVSVAYYTQVTVTLVNPDNTGLYDVLVKPGDFQRCLVIHHPYSDEGRQSLCTVVRLSEPRNWINVHTGNLYAKPIEKVDEESDYRSWYDKQSGVGENGLKTNTWYIVVTKDGQGSCPFEVREKVDDGLYDVNFRSYASDSTPSWQKSLRWGPPRQDIDAVGDCCGRSQLRLNPARQGLRLKLIGRTLNVPDEAKVLVVRPAEGDKEWNKAEKIKYREESSNPPVDPSALSDIPLDILGSSRSPGTGKEKEAEFVLGEPGDLDERVIGETAPLKLFNNGTEAWVNDSPSMTVKQALFTLIRNHGFREEVAATMLKEAGLKNGLRARVKYADNYPMLGEGPTAPPFPGPVYSQEFNYPGVPSLESQEEEQYVPGLNSSNYDHRGYDPRPEYMEDPLAQQTAQQAAQSGQKEIFDTTMIAGLLKSLRQDSLIKKHLASIMGAMNSFGALLLNFYWSNEKWEDLLGKSQLPESEDLLRNGFELCGDAALHLREAIQSPMANDYSNDADIDEAAQG